MTGIELKQKREALGYTQTELSEIFEVKPNTLARWEREVLRPPKWLDYAMKSVPPKRARTRHK